LQDRNLDFDIQTSPKASPRCMVLKRRDLTLQF